jgi:hypothetical protein
LQALPAIITAIVAVAALIGVKYQIDASYRVQREQSARKLYCKPSGISIANPDYGQPGYCAFKGPPKLLKSSLVSENETHRSEQGIVFRELANDDARPLLLLHV